MFPEKISKAHRPYRRIAPRKHALFFIKTLFTVIYIQSVPTYIGATRILSDMKKTPCMYYEIIVSGT